MRGVIVILLVYNAGNPGSIVYWGKFCLLFVFSFLFSFFFSLNFEFFNVIVQAALSKFGLPCAFLGKSVLYSFS